MTSPTETPSLTSLYTIFYQDKNGAIPEFLQGKIGVYAIFDRDQNLQLVAYSRDVYFSLKQHLIRQPQKCYWIKVQTIERPKRSVLEEIREAWIAENGSPPPGNDTEQANWTQPIDTKSAMTEEEKAQDQNSEELAQIKLLKKVARRVEAEIVEELKVRGVQMEMRFSPKLK